MTPTPGPWVVESTATAKRDPEALLPDECNFWIVDQGQAGEVLALVLDTSRDEAAANADLLAAAPDLLVCLRRMCGMYGAYSRRLAPLLAEDQGTVWTFERANSLALEAIAKAEGRS